MEAVRALVCRVADMGFPRGHQSVEKVAASPVAGPTAVCTVIDPYYVVSARSYTKACTSGDASTNECGSTSLQTAVTRPKTPKNEILGIRNGGQKRTPRSFQRARILSPVRE